MIIPGALMGVTDYVYVAGVAANPDSITAVLYRWVGSTRSASGITVTCTSVGSGEYRFTWTNDAGFARTDELELVALPVVSGVTYPATVWRSHGSVDAVVPTAAAGAIGGLLTAPTTANTGLADVTRLLGTAWLTPGTAGTPDVNLTTTALGAIWNRLTSSMSVAGSIGKKLADWVVGTIDTYTGNTPQTGDSYARLGAPSGASVAADIAAVPTASQNAAAVEAAILNEGDATALLAAIAAKVEEFLINEGDATATIAAIAAACNAAVAAGTVGTNAATAATQASAANTKIGTPVVSVSADIAAVKAETALTVADTNELQADWADGGRLDSILDARASQTSVNTIGTDITTLLGRVTSNVYTMWTNLIAMITGSGGTAAFTTTALANAPAGGGGGGSGDASQDTLLEVQDTVDALAISLAGTVITVVNRVTGGTINAVMGDDYKVRSGSELSIVVDDPAGALHTRLAAIGVGNLAFGASRVGEAAGEITGTIASLSYLSDVLTIVVEITACGASLRPDNYTYQIQSSQTQGAEVDDVVEVTGRLVLSRRTVAAVS